MSLEPVPLLFRARGTTRESLIEGAKQKHTQREGLYDLRIRCRGVGHYVLVNCVAENNIYSLKNTPIDSGDINKFSFSAHHCYEIVNCQMTKVSVLSFSK